MSIALIAIIQEKVEQAKALLIQLRDEKNSLIAKESALSRTVDSLTSSLQESQVCMCLCVRLAAGLLSSIHSSDNSPLFLASGNLSKADASDTRDTACAGEHSI